MAKQRPQLGTFAQPASQFVAPIQQQATPVNQQEIRNTLAFADAFGELSQTVVKFASMLKTEQNKEEFAAGQKLVDGSRQSYMGLVKSGQIDPSENPWFAIGAQTASGKILADQARAEFQTEYDRQVSENPDLLLDTNFFDSFAAQFAANKQAQFGTTQYLSASFFDSFNPFVAQAGLKNANEVTQYRMKRIVDGMTSDIREALSSDMNRVGFLPNKSSLNGMTTQMGVYEVPVAVPSLTEDELAILEVNGVDALTPEMTEKIYKHAAERMQRGMSPFSQRDLAERTAVLQHNMDETGAVTGNFRTANLATASRLIDLARQGDDPWMAEGLLNGLKTKSGMIRDLPEVKRMFAEFEAEIEANKIRIRKARAENHFFGYLENVLVPHVTEYSPLGYENNYKPAVDEFMQTYGDLFNEEEKSKLRGQARSAYEAGEKAWNDRRWGSAADSVEMVFKDGFRDWMTSLGDPTRPPQFQVDLAHIKAEVDTALQNIPPYLGGGINPDDPQYGQAMRMLRRRFDSWLNDVRTAALSHLSKQFGSNIESLEPSENDTPAIRAAKVNTAREIEAASILLGVEFNDDTRYSSFRRTANKAMTRLVHGDQSQISLYHGVFEYLRMVNPEALGDILDDRQIQYFENLSAELASNGGRFREAAENASISAQQAGLLPDAKLSTKDEEKLAYKVESVVESFHPSVRQYMRTRLYSAALNAYMRDGVSSINEAIDAVESIEDHIEIGGGSLLARDALMFNNDPEMLNKLLDYEASELNKGRREGETKFSRDNLMIIPVGDVSPRGNGYFVLRDLEGQAVSQKVFTYSDINSSAYKQKIFTFSVNENRRAKAEKARLRKEQQGHSHAP